MNIQIVSVRTQNMVCQFQGQALNCNNNYLKIFLNDEVDANILIKSWLLLKWFREWLEVIFSLPEESEIPSKNVSKRLQYRAVQWALSRLKDTKSY